MLFKHDEELSSKDALEQLKIGFNDYIGNQVLSKVDLGDMGIVINISNPCSNMLFRNFLHWFAAEEVSRFRETVSLHTKW